MMRASCPVPLLISIALGISGASAADPPGPAPDAGATVDAILSQRLLHSLSNDRLGLQRYRFVESATIEKRDTDGSLRSRSVEVNEIFYRDGTRMKRPLSEDEANPPDGVSMVRREEERFLPPPSSGKAAARKDRSRLFDIEKLVTCFRFEPLGHETVDGHDLRKVAFTPVDECIDDGSRAGRILQNLTGTLWIDARAAALIRIQGHLLRPVTFGFGLLGRVEDLTIEVEREPLEGELFAISRVDYRARGTSFIFNRFDVRSVRQRSAFSPAFPQEDAAHLPTALALPGPAQPGPGGGQR